MTKKPTRPSTPRVPKAAQAPLTPAAARAEGKRRTLSGWLLLGAAVLGLLLVTIFALVEADGQRATVYVLDREKNVARRKDVTLGPLLGEQVIVTAGLASGEPVITDGAAWLTDGRSVRVVGDDRG